LEVSGHRFCDLSEGNFGASVITDYKYGYTVRDQTIGISLLKAPKFPWDGTDMKSHRFCYSLLVHNENLGDPDCQVMAQAHINTHPIYLA
jgi:alpha-mannosidase